jgi:hypothetical protein
MDVIRWWLSVHRTCLEKPAYVAVNRCSNGCFADVTCRGQQSLGWYPEIQFCHLLQQKKQGVMAPFYLRKRKNKMKKLIAATLTAALLSAPIL